MNQIFAYDQLEDLIVNFLPCSKFTAKVYLKIATEPIQKDELYAYFKENHELISESLEFLTSNCFISDYYDRTHINTYFSIDPQFAFPALLVSRMWEVDSSLHTLKDLSLRQDLLELNEQLKKCNQIVEQLKKIYKKQLPFLKEIAIVVSGSKRIASCISELMETANKEILAVVSPPHLLGEIVWNTVVDKMSQGISYNRITTFDELPYHGYVIFKNEVLNYNETLYISEKTKLTHKFYIIDDLTIVFFTPDWKCEDFKYEVQVINNSGIAKTYRDIYDNFKNSSINLTELLDAFSAYRASYLKKASLVLGNEELKWLEEVFDYGVFCKHDKYSSNVYESAKKKCIDAKFITIDMKENIIANYNLEEVKAYGHQ